MYESGSYISFEILVITQKGKNNCAINKDLTNGLPNVLVKKESESQGTRSSSRSSIVYL